MFLDKLGDWIGVGIILAGIGVQSVEKVFTEQYRPWSGECLCRLVRTRPSTVFYLDSPELSKLMKVDEFQKQVRSGQGVTYYSPPDLTSFPHFNAPDTNAKIVQSSAVSCEGGSLGFAKIRLTSGPNKNKTGWVCDGLYRTAVMP